jgi:nonribosomal peptide synthetase DhbF
MRSDVLASRFDGYTLTSAQAAIWAAQQISPGSLDYILSDVFEIRGRLNLAIFRKAVIETLRPIDQVNVRFFEVNGIPRQLPAGTAAQPEVVDLTGAADAIRIAEQDMRAQLNRPVDLTSGPWAANKIYQIEKDLVLGYPSYRCRRDRSRADGQRDCGNLLRDGAW